MTTSLEQYVLDNGLTLLDTASVFIWIAQAEPTSALVSGWTAGTSGNSLLGFKSFAAGALFNSPSGSTGPRTVTSNAITDGTITTTGTAVWWATGISGTMHAHGTLSATQAVTATNTFSLGAFSIIIPNAP